MFCISLFCAYPFLKARAKKKIKIIHEIEIQIKEENIHENDRNNFLVFEKNKNRF